MSREYADIYTHLASVPSYIATGDSGWPEEAATSLAAQTAGFETLCKKARVGNSAVCCGDACG